MTPQRDAAARLGVRIGVGGSAVRIETGEGAVGIGGAVVETGSFDHNALDIITPAVGCIAVGGAVVGHNCFGCTAGSAAVGLAADAFAAADHLPAVLAASGHSAAGSAADNCCDALEGRIPADYTAHKKILAHY